jgi:hypothetical protein
MGRRDENAKRDDKNLHRQRGHLASNDYNDVFLGNLTRSGVGVAVITYTLAAAWAPPQLVRR